MLLIANWLPPASWGFQSCYVVFEISVSKYWTSFCKLAVLSIIKKPLNLLNLSNETSGSIVKPHLNSISLELSPESLSLF